MTTLAQFYTQVSAKMGLNNTAGSADQALMNFWANQAYAEIVATAKPSVSSATMAMTANVSDYTLDTAILEINEIYLTQLSDQQPYKLNRVSPQEIINYRVGTQFIGAPPVRFYALNGASLLMVYPTPQQADTVTIYYVPRPTPLTAAGDSPSAIPEEWHKVIEYWMLWNAGQYTNDGPSKNGEAFHALFQMEMTLLKKGAQHRGGRKLSPAVVGRRFGRQRQIGLPSQQDV